MFEKLFKLYDRFGAELQSHDLAILFENQLLLECQFNLNLIDCLKSHNLEQQSKELNEVIGLLETKMLDLYLPQKIEIKTTLSKLSDTCIDMEDDIFEADLIQNIILKIKTLKALSQLTVNNNDSFKKLQFKRRLNNVKEKLLLLKQALVKTAPKQKAQLN